MTKPITINEDWRWHRDGHSVVLERRGAIKTQKGRGSPPPEEKEPVWNASYFSSLGNALNYLLEVDASAAGSLREFTMRLNKAKVDVKAMISKENL